MYMYTCHKLALAWMFVNFGVPIIDSLLYKARDETFSRNLFYGCKIFSFSCLGGQLTSIVSLIDATGNSPSNQ